jgi:hypothetical protein
MYQRQSLPAPARDFNPSNSVFLFFASSSALKNFAAALIFFSIGFSGSNTPLIYVIYFIIKISNEVYSILTITGACPFSFQAMP